MESATIMEIQRYSIHDGPGIRTTVFLKGCHMACRWCHNPESQRGEPEMMYYPGSCIGCGACGSFCDRGAVGWEDGGHTVSLELCRDCGKKEACAKNCPAQALKLCGRVMTAEEVLEQVLRDRGFYGSGDLLSRGGVTCSGGEPLLQGDFLRELLQYCRFEEVGTCVDTTLNVDWDSVERVLPFTELFLVDLKFMDDEKAAAYTGRDYRRARENLQALSGLGKPVIVRVPLAAGVNDTTEETSARRDFLSGLRSVLRVDEFYVTNHAAQKYLALQRENWLAGRENGREQ